MRVTGGIARGIQLRVPTQGGVRPATDYIREAVFNSLAAFVPGTAVLDLFAGTGAYGLESLSRGALRATCVDQRIGAELTANAAAVAKSMGLAELPFTKITGDATKPGVAEGRFDLVFADPPWELWQTKGAEIAATAVSYAEEGAHVRVILEAPGGFDVPVPEGWKLRKVIGKGKGQPAASVLVRKAAE
ncbi:MAG: RsmD family RNA methyltransferase [Opitutales bacterium]|jgi:16S rRNA (guanine966-N2)-methyltransferase